MSYSIYFDSFLKTRKGKVVPFYDRVMVEKDEPIKDKTLMWFHESYGYMKLYRLHKVDDENYIAEDTKTSCRTNNENWKKFLENPILALN